MALSPTINNILSDSLSREITLNARSKYFVAHPLFANMLQCFDTCYTSTCTAFDGTVYALNDIVFKAETWSSGLCVMAHGSYCLQQKHQTLEFTDQLAWFAEVSLFARALHHSTLTSLGFSDAYSLSPRDFSQCVKQSPGCTVLVIKYAQAFLNSLWDGDHESCPHDKHMVDDFLPKSVAEAAYDGAVEKAVDVPSIVLLPVTDADRAEELVKGIWEGTFQDDYVIENLPIVFSELDEDEGLYAQVNEHTERKRAMTAMLSLYWIQGNRYEAFVESQAFEKCMPESLWHEWRLFFAFCNPTQDMVHVLLVFLCIRGLSKSKILSKMLGLSEWASQSAILHRLLEHDYIPAVKTFNGEMHELLASIINFHETFNLPQFLQGENLPFHLEALDLKIQLEGETSFRCYLVALVAMMCGLAGSVTTKGSLFCDNENGRTLLLGVQCSQRVGLAKPHAIYWGYISSRARPLNYDCEDVESHVLARLACLTRCTSPEDMDMLKEAWEMLSYAEKSILVKAFIADGVFNKAEVLTMLHLGIGTTTGAQSSTEP